MTVGRWGSLRTWLTDAKLAGSHVKGAGETHPYRFRSNEAAAACATEQTADWMRSRADHYEFAPMGAHPKSTDPAEWLRWLADQIDNEGTDEP